MDALDFKNTYFIVTYIDNRKFNGNIQSPVSIKDFRNHLFATYICKVPLGSTLKMSFSPIINNEFWKERITRIIILDYKSIDDLFITTIMYGIAQDSVDIFLQPEKVFGETIKNIKLLSDLLIETFPDIRMLFKSDKDELRDCMLGYGKLESLPLLFNMSNGSFSRIDFENIYSYFLLRPQNSENEKIYGTRKNVLEFILKFEAFRNRDFAKGDNAYIPYFTPEYIESFHSDFKLLNPTTRILIGNSYPNVSSQSYIECGILKLIETDVCIHVLKNISNKIESEAIYKESIDGFTKAIIDKKNSLQIIKKYYEETHLRISNNLYDFELLNLKFNSEIKSTNIYFPENNRDIFELKEFLKGEVTKFHSWSFYSSKFEELNNARNKLEMLMSQLRKRSAIIYEILNTFYLIHSTDANIKLQRQIKRITWITVIIGFFTIVTTIFSFELHKIFMNLFSMSVNWFR